MTDPLRTGRLPDSADVSERDRDAHIEELLLAGLDHYFSEQHEQAINVWTRVLFIDRGHARARAYIERARSAVAERQRKGDELLHTGSAALDRGDAAAARRLVASAVEHGASPDEALTLLARIDRLEIAAARPEPAPRRSDPRTVRGVPAAAAAPAARWKWIGGGIVAGLLLSALGMGLVVQGGVASGFFGRSEQPASTLNAPLPVLSIAEVALSRGEALHARGRLHEALAALEAVPTGDPLRPRADVLTATIQRQLLSAARSAERAQPEGDPRRP
jgi:tetratricopeptide (TPR) repeat protein